MFKILQFVTSPADQKRTISLRLIEWYVTDCVRYVVPNKKVVSEYADNLNIYTRKMFDPFRRGKQRCIQCGDLELHTTIGQMNFFKWFIESKLWETVTSDALSLSQLMALHPEAKYKQVSKTKTSSTKMLVEKPKSVFSGVLVFD